MHEVAPSENDDVVEALVPCAAKKSLAPSSPPSACLIALPVIFTSPARARLRAYRSL
jgi:hypothetical protein